MLRASTFWTFLGRQSLVPRAPAAAPSDSCHLFRTYSTLYCLALPQATIMWLLESDLFEGKPRNRRFYLQSLHPCFLQAYLQLTRKPGKKLWLRPGKLYLFGRTVSEAGQLVISDKTISRKHITIKVEPVPEGGGVCSTQYC